MRIVIRILKITAFIVLGVLLLAAGLLITGWALSPGKTPPITNAYGSRIPNSIASLEKMTLGGIEQWVLIRGKNRNNPVLLFLHGGPGSPEMPMIRAFNAALEEHFVVVNWDQRGSGKSFSETIPAQSFTIEQFVSDTHELVARLRKRFGGRKMFLMGHSWGSVLGVLAVHQHPEPFYAYIGIGQVANMQAGEKLSYEFALTAARQYGNEQAIEELTQVGEPPYAGTSAQVIEKTLIERKWITEFGGAWYGKKSMNGIIGVVLTTEEYTLREKVNYLNGSLRTLQLLWQPLMQIDLFTQAPNLAVPVFIFQGTYDYQTPYVIAKRYFDQLQSPHKEFFTFKKTAHSPIYESPAQFHELLLTRVLPLAKNQSVADRVPADE